MSKTKPRTTLSLELYSVKSQPAFDILDIVFIHLPLYGLHTQQSAQTTLTSRPMEITFYFYKAEKHKTAQMQRPRPNVCRSHH